MAEPIDNPVAAQDNTAPATAENIVPENTADKPLVDAGEDKPAETEDAPLIDPKADDKDKTPEAPAGAPESYADFTMPEGFKLDDARKGEMNALFKELNLTQEGGQKLVNTYCKFMQETAKAQEAELLETRRNWRKEVSSREGYREQAALARKGLRLLVKTDAQRTLLTNSWLQDSPAIFDLFVEAGKLVAEDTIDGRQSAKQKTESEINRERFPVK